MRGYGRKNVSPRCLVQMDIQKAYDTVDWQALQHIMVVKMYGKVWCILGSEKMVLVDD